jgi:hypothetical protein
MIKTGRWGWKFDRDLGMVAHVVWCVVGYVRVLENAGQEALEMEADAWVDTYNPIGDSMDWQREWLWLGFVSFPALL